MRQVACGALLLVGCFLTSPEGAHGQSTLETIWGDFKTAPGDVWYVWSAPARVGSDEVAPLVLFTGATLLVAANDAALQQWFREHPNSFVLQVLEPFRQRNGLLSELGRNHKVMRGAAAGYVLGLVTGWDWLREASFGCAVGNTANALPRGLTYRLIARARPSGETDPYQFDFPGGDWDQHSFFGGHAANAFTRAFSPTAGIWAMPSRSSGSSRRASPWGGPRTRPTGCRTPWSAWASAGRSAA